MIIRENCPFCTLPLYKSGEENDWSYVLFCQECKCDTDHSMPQYLVKVSGKDVQEEYGWKNLYIKNNFTAQETYLCFLEGSLITKSIKLPYKYIDFSSLSIEEFERKLKLWLTFS